MADGFRTDITIEIAGKLTVIYVYFKDFRHGRLLFLSINLMYDMYRGSGLDLDLTVYQKVGPSHRCPVF